MAALDHQVQEDSQERRAKRKDVAKRPRLTADPSVGVRDLTDTIRNYVTYKDTKDLASLVLPGGHRVLSWKSSPDADFMLKVSGICYDFIMIHRNTKVSSKKLREAIGKLLQGKEIINSTGKNDRIFIDQMDLCLRIALAMFRSCKQDAGRRDLVMKRLEKDERKRMGLIFEKIALPQDFEDDVSDVDQEVLCEAVVPEASGLEASFCQSFSFQSNTVEVSEPPPLPAPADSPEPVKRGGEPSSGARRQVLYCDHKVQVKFHHNLFECNNDDEMLKNEALDFKPPAIAKAKAKAKTKAKAKAKGNVKVTKGGMKRPAKCDAASTAVSRPFMLGRCVFCYQCQVLQQSLDK